MYSPKISPEFIPILYKIGKVQGKPMTVVVREALAHYLKVLNTEDIEKQFHTKETIT